MVGAAVEACGLALRLEIVDHRTEAYLAVTGCAALADPRAQSVIVFDIGGGSTEIAWLDGRAARPLVAHINDASPRPPASHWRRDGRRFDA